MKIGAHVSTAKPFSEAVNRAAELGCECMQIFVNPPQRWNPIPVSDEEVVKFNSLESDKNIYPIIIHGIYLLNLASSNTYFYDQSIRCLIDDMRKGSKIKALGVAFHVGSTKGSEMREVLPKIKNAIEKILDESPKDQCLIIENSAGAGNIIGDTLEEIAEILDAVRSDRLKVLIDTAHAFESGYDLRNEEGINKFITKFDQLIGLDKLVGFHLNDSKTSLDSKRDRHADIGTGEIGLETFRYLLTHPKLQDKCGILETPQDKSGWIDQIRLLKNLRA